MPTYKEVAKQIPGLGDREGGSGATEDEIRRAEAALGVKIAGGFRAFLRQRGWGSVADMDFYGLGADVPMHLDLVGMTQSERTEMYPPIPPHLLPFRNDGGGNHYCLDTSANEIEPPIVFWDHELGPDQEPYFYAKDFATWLAERLEEMREGEG